jgi:hypothetical protein
MAVSVAVTVLSTDQSMAQITVLPSNIPLQSRPCAYFQHKAFCFSDRVYGRHMVAASMLHSSKFGRRTVMLLHHNSGLA